MKYGMLMYKNTDNIGDDIQSLAAIRFLPKIDYIIEREALDSFHAAEGDKPVSVIMNGWYLHNKINWPPSADINPLWISAHMSLNDNYQIGADFLDGIGGEYFKHYAPVGARDQSTMKLLQKKGIDCYLSGCLTLTLSLPQPETKTDEVILVDVDKADEQVIRAAFPQVQLIHLTHHVDVEENSKLSPEGRLSQARGVLARYQRAKCVITSRLHCALPCLALGTPVLLLYEPQNSSRMETFLPFLHECTSNDLPLYLHEYDLNAPPRNLDLHLPMRDALIQVCTDFIQNCKNNIVHDPYLCSAVEIQKWQKNLMYGKEILVHKVNEQLNNWFKTLEQGKAYLEEQLHYRDERINELLKWNEALEQGKAYLEKQTATRDARITELTQWIEELEQGKAYLEEQVATRDARITELTQWIEELEQGKAYLETQWIKTQDAFAASSAQTDEQSLQISKLTYKLNLLLGDTKIQKIISKKKYEI